MTKVSDVYKYIDSFAPFRTQDSWDNSGLLAGDENAQVHKALVALDAENRIIDEAHREGCELLITHHPVIFHPLKTVCFDDPAGRLVRYGMSCICAHTNLDSAQYGISDMMLYRLGFKNCHELVQINRRDSLSDRAVGYGAIGECSEMTPEELAKLCAERFRCVAIKYVAGKRNIKTGAPAAMKSLGLDWAPAALAGPMGAKKVATAFAVSLTINTMFAPAMMVAHKVADLHLEHYGGRLESLRRMPRPGALLRAVDWEAMWDIVLFRGVVFFWIPAHTVTFLLPEAFRVLFAAALGAVLGLILAWAGGRRSASAPAAAEADAG